MLPKTSTRRGNANVNKSRRLGSGEGSGITPLDLGASPQKGTGTNVEIPGWAATVGKGVLDVAKQALGHAAGDGLTDLRRSYQNKA